MVFQPGDPPPFYVPNAVDYVGKNKGILQILYERGLYVEGMEGRQREKDKALYEFRGAYYI